MARGPALPPAGTLPDPVGAARPRPRRGHALLAAGGLSAFPAGGAWRSLSPPPLLFFVALFPRSLFVGSSAAALFVLRRVFTRVRWGGKKDLARWVDEGGIEIGWASSSVDRVHGGLGAVQAARN